MKTLILIISLIISLHVPLSFAQSCDPDDPACPLPSSQTQPSSPGSGTSISGNDLCGATEPCAPSDFTELARRFRNIFITVGSVALVAILGIRVALSWFTMRTQGAVAIKDAGMKAFNSLLGFLFVVAALGGMFFALLTAFGAQPWAVKLLQLFSGGFIEHAYAQTSASTQLLPNPLGSNSLYDIIISAANLAIRFFVYPAVIAMWVWSGFQFIYSQGNSDGLKKAKAWLFWAFVITIITFSLQGFIVAFRATADKIVPTSTTSTTP